MDVTGLKPAVFHSSILGGRVNFPLCLAPMVGLSHVALRMLIRQFLPPGAVTLWPTEMLNSRRLPNEDFSKTPEVYRDRVESELIPQILGNSKDPIQKSIEKLQEWGAEAIDINMGCPVEKALRHNYGVALMGDPHYAAEVVRMAKSSTHLPVTVKLRGVQNENSEKLIYFIKCLEEAGADWLCLHPRAPEQFRRGSADWTQVARVKKVIHIPLIGNGDIQVSSDVQKRIAESNCDLVMAGRALAARPWLFWQVGREYGFKDPSQNLLLKLPSTPEEEGQAYGICLLALIDLCRNYFLEEQALRRVRFYLRTTTCWLDFGQTLLGEAARATCLDELKFRIKKVFSESEIKMSPRTELRQ